MSWPKTAHECVMCGWATFSHPIGDRCARCLGFGTMIPITVAPIETSRNVDGDEPPEEEAS